ncbi:uncharacterized protein LOC142625439 [Castanea sativa]|uniref:uncharacterized protein LOC142625439 n=1 Tax=Castanea sativa TaxID=21020 RepID=UPI003F64EF19
MAPPKNVKEVQSLNGKIAALNRFVSRATDKCLPFFHTLKRSFEWTAESLVKEDDKVQKPVYYASQVLHGAKERYPPTEKLAFALVTAAHKLKPYFQAHTVIVLTDKPSRRAISSPKADGRIALWAIELSEFDIQYRPRTAIKGQVVADFIAEFTNAEGQGARYP